MFPCEIREIFKNTFFTEHFRCMFLCGFEMGIRQKSFNKLLWVMTSNASDTLTLSWQRWIPYRNQSIDLQNKSIDWFLYDRDLRHERLKDIYWTS